MTDKSGSDFDEIATLLQLAGINEVRMTLTIDIPCPPEQLAKMGLSKPGNSVSFRSAGDMAAWLRAHNRSADAP